jgi:hypothetical protein
MSAGSGRTSIVWLSAVAACACDGQFDFDTSVVDAGPPPIVVPDAALDDAPANDTIVDPPRIGVHIACGASECVSSECCVESAGMSCVSTAEGGTCGGLLIQCDDTDDCPAGQVCCAEGDDHSLPVCPDARDCEERPKRVHCETESHCRTMNFVILCNPDRPEPCTQCILTTLQGLPPGYHQCATGP